MPDETLTLDPSSQDRHYIRDLWQYRELLYFLAWRDVLVRYKQTALGIAWAFLQPLVIMVVFTVIFGRLAEFPSGGVPYPALVLCAMLPWQFFASSFSGASASIIGNANLISKVYFPRAIIPISAVLTSVVDLAIAGCLLAAILIYYGIVPGWQLLTLPLFTGIAFATALGAGFWFTALNVKYRDFKYVVPFAIQLGLYVSPVGFSSDIIPEQWRLLYSLNPLVGVIDGFRWAILGGPFQLYLPGFLLSLGIVLALLVSGIYYFRRTERSFADVI